MNTWKTFILVAREESKQGRRGGLFWLLFVLTVVLIGLCHLSLQSEMNLRAPLDGGLPCSFPLVNSILFNLLQCCFILFAVLHYFSREKSLDTLETLRVKPVSGTCYTLGKAVGIALPFFWLGVCSLVVAAFIQLAWSNSPFRPGIYLFYLFTFTLPLLVFVAGLAMFVHGMVRQRMVALQVLLVLAVTSYAFLASSPFVDPFARFLPNVFSDVTGFVEPRIYLSQRGAFLLVGTGFLLASVIFTRRLADRREKPGAVALLGIGLLAGGLGLGYSNFARQEAEQATRKLYRATAMKYTPTKQLTTRTYDIVFRQEGDEIHVKSHLAVENRDSLPVQRVHFYLNPGLRVSSLQEGGKTLAFRRENQVVEVDRPMVPGERVTFTWSYEGKIDERACYLEVPWDRLNTPEKLARWDAWYGELGVQGTPGRRFCYVDERFTLLLPENMWYPTLLPPVDVNVPLETRSDFSRYTLKVVNNRQGKVTSQGTCTLSGDTLIFRNEEVLPGITLCRGNHEEVNNGETRPLFSLRSFKGHELRPLLRDHVSDMFTPEFFNNLQVHTRFTRYAHDRFYCVEVPIAFTSYYRYWKENGEFMQPEIFFQREYWEANVVRRAVSTKGESRPNAHVGHFSTFQKHHRERNVVSLFSRTVCQPTEYTIWPALLKNTLWRSYGRWQRPGSNSPSYNHERYELEAKKYLNGHSLKDALREEKLDEEVRYKIMDLKGEELLAYLTCYSSTENVATLADTILQAASPMMDETQFLQLIQACTGVDLSTFLPEWYTASTLPQYQITDEHYLKGNEQHEGEHVSFKIRNKGKANGFIGIPKDFWLYDYISLKQGECKEITVPTANRYFKLNIGLSKNVPGNLDYVFSKRETHPFEPGVKRIDSSFFQNKEQAIIVDNSSPYFRLESGRVPLLQRLFRSDKQDTDYFSTQGTRWMRTVNGRCHGDEVRDAFYKLAGNGTCKAIWEAPIQEAGEYEVFFYDVDINFFKMTFSLIPARERHYIVKDRDGEHEINISRYAASGWVSLGRFHFEPGKASVILTDKGQEKEWENPLHLKARDFFTWKSMIHIKNVSVEIIIADAVKWVKVE